MLAARAVGVSFHPGWLLVVALAHPSAAVPQWNGDLTLQGRAFGSARDSLARTEPTLTLSLDGWFDSRYLDVSLGAQIRLDPSNRDRSRFDLDGTYVRAPGSVDLLVGFQSVRWGVLESARIVDIINQTDPEARWPHQVFLSQPMVVASLSLPVGEIDAYLLPWARPRPFAGRSARTWSGQDVSGSACRYTSSSFEKRHLAWAARWTLPISVWDLGISYFDGTDRDPYFEPRFTSDGVHSYVPIYSRVRRVGLEMQFTAASWLGKLELASAHREIGSYTLLGGGIEYAPTNYLSLVAEFLYDSRAAQSTTSLERDVFVGTRLSFQDGYVAGGFYVDMSSRNVIGSLAVMRRFGDDLAMGLELRGFRGSRDSEPQLALLEESSLALSLVKYY